MKKNTFSHYYKFTVERIELLLNIVSRGNISEIFENFTFLLEINTLANKSYVISKLIPLGKHVERS